MKTYAQIKETLSELDNLDKCDFLFELGSDLKMPKKLKIENNRVHGCQSNVWIFNEIQDYKICILAESDSKIINGLIVILLSLYNNKTPEEVLAINIKGEMVALGLEHFVSAQRRNGLSKMVERIQNFASDQTKSSKITD